MKPSNLDRPSIRSGRSASACERGEQSVEKSYLTPLDGARLISSITATLFGYDELSCVDFT